MQGFLSGIVVGAALGAVVVIAVSQVAPVVDLSAPPPEAGAVEVPPGSQFSAERPDAPPILPGTEGRPGNPDVPMVDAPELAAEGLPDTDPLEAPDAGALTDEELSPPEVPPAPEIVVGVETDAGIRQQAGDDASNLPEALQAEAPDQAAERLPETDPLEAPDTGALPDEDLSPPEVPPAPEIVVGGGTDARTQEQGAEAMPQQPEADEPDAGIDAGTGASAVKPAILAQPAAPNVGSESTDQGDAPVIAMPEPPDGLRLPVPEIDDMAPGIVSDRLPRIGAAAENPEDPEELALPALERYSVPFEGVQQGNPLIAMILVDVGDVRPPMDQISAFPIPLAIALDPTVPDAGILMQAYRQAGREVVVLTPLPDGADPADVEVAFQSYFDALPQAVAVLDIPEAALQESRPRAAQVVDILASSGHGLITYDRGFNTGLQIADQAGVPARIVFRNIDPGQHDVAAMKRFLDQAAFKAGQEGAVILIAEVRPETLTALAEWTLGTRAASVTFAPVSAILKAN